MPPPETSTVESSREGSVAGSPQYMAPEQATGDSRPDARTDLYGLGAVAYFLLTGRPPFNAATAMAVMIAVSRDPVDPPSQYHSGLPADLEGVVLRCLAKSPADRYQDADALDRDLAACAAATEWDFARAAEWWRSQSGFMGRSAVVDERVGPKVVIVKDYRFGPTPAHFRGLPLTLMWPYSFDAAAPGSHQNSCHPRSVNIGAT